MKARVLVRQFGGASATLSSLETGAMETRPRGSSSTSGALKQAKIILSGLEVDAQQMRRKIDLTHGLVMSEAVMMGLGPFTSREYAHDLVYDICREALRLKRPLIELLAEHPEINRHLTRAQLASLCDPMNYLGQAGPMVDRVLDSIKT